MAAVRNFLVTGANTGLGFKTTQNLCGRGHHVILACRSQKKAEAAIADLRKENPNAKVTFMELDLSSLASVRKFADAFAESKLPLHSLVNNAGIFNIADQSRHTTADGYELTLGTNHLGHFLLSHLMKGHLQKSAAEAGKPSTLVFVSSSMHNPAFASKGNPMPVHKIDFDDLFLEKEGAYNSLQAYKNSKAANIMTTMKLAQELAGSGVLVNSLCPGLIPEVVQKTNEGTVPGEILSHIIAGFSTSHKELVRTPEQSGAYIADLAVGDSLNGQTGKFFVVGEVGEPAEEVKDEQVRDKMWDVSTKLVGLQ